MKRALIVQNIPLIIALQHKIFSLSIETSRLTRDGTTAEPVSRDQILRRERGQGNIQLPCIADHQQDWQPHPVDPYSCYMCDYYTYIQHKTWGRIYIEE